MTEFNAAWRAFLIECGALLDEQGVRHYGDPHQELRTVAAGDAIADLSHLSLIRVRGEDARAFLQGQLSNDIGLVSENHSQVSAYCNPKGRMYAVFRIFLRDDCYFLQLPAALAPAVVQRLRLFVLRARVSLQDADAELVRIGLSGPGTPQILSKVFAEPPAAVDEGRNRDGLTVLRLPGPHPRFELVGLPERIQRLWQALVPQVRPVGADAWSWLDIRAGVPVILPGTVEEFVPQMVNLELIGGVSFTKGCYPGQEIVARVKYLGRIKQRMVPAHASAQLRPPPGTPLYVPVGPDQAVGQVVDARPAPQGGFDMLVVITLEHAGREVRLAGPDGPPLAFGELPYALELVS